MGSALESGAVVMVRIKPDERTTEPKGAVVCVSVRANASKRSIDTSGEVVDAAAFATNLVNAAS